jgi:hypothetical protein
MPEIIEFYLTLEEVEIIREMCILLEHRRFFLHFPEIGRVLDEINKRHMRKNKGKTNCFTFLVLFDDEQIKKIRFELSNRKLGLLINDLKVEHRKTFSKIKREITKRFLSDEGPEKDIIEKIIQHVPTL